MEGAAGFLTRWEEDCLRVLLRPAVAAALGVAVKRRRSDSTLLWRIRQRVPALVTRWQVGRVHFQPRRKHFAVDARCSGRCAEADSCKGPPLPARDGELKHYRARSIGKTDASSTFGYRRHWTYICTLRSLDA